MNYARIYELRGREGADALGMPSPLLVVQWYIKHVHVIISLSMIRGVIYYVTHACGETGSGGRG
jgi:hypothetical protein